jgi:acetolactate synthase-1/2/3 large subunit
MAKPNPAVVKDRYRRSEAGHGKLRDQVRRAEAAGDETSTITAPWVCRMLSEMLPSDTIFVDETITYRPATLRHLTLKQPQTSFRVGGGLGQGFGTALGLKTAAPERCVALVLGDGAFLYNPTTQCLALSDHARLPILVIILNNNSYRSMALEHRNFYPDGVAVAQDLFYGGAITEFDYAELVRPFGGFGRRVAKRVELQPALEQALAAVKGGKTAILNIMVD